MDGGLAKDFGLSPKRKRRLSYFIISYILIHYQLFLKGLWQQGKGWGSSTMSKWRESSP